MPPNFYEVKKHVITEHHGGKTHNAGSFKSRDVHIYTYVRV